MAQVESVFNCPAWVRQTFAKLREVFPVVKAYLGTIPTYPGGLWIFAFCCKHPEVAQFFDEARYEELQLDLRCYNKAIHRACFALPNFVQELCQGKWTHNTPFR